MRRWIAHEHDDATGWPTDAFLVVTAETQQDAKRVMADAIRMRRDVAPLALQARLSAIFIEAPVELASDDPRARLISRNDRPLFIGFDRPAAAPAPRELPRRNGRRH